MRRMPGTSGPWKSSSIPTSRRATSRRWLPPTMATATGPGATDRPPEHPPPGRGSTGPVGGVAVLGLPEEHLDDREAGLHPLLEDEPGDVLGGGIVLHHVDAFP